jgi:hypothetical protein
MRQSRHEALAIGLGWFSIALGVAELFMTRNVARATGLEGREALLRFYGAREIASGVGLLMSSDRKTWLWGRVAGDAADLATLASSGTHKSAAAMLAVGGVAALDVYAAASATFPARVEPVRDYSMRSGFPKPAGEMRGIARRADTRARQATGAVYAPS